MKKKPPSPTEEFPLVLLDKEQRKLYDYFVSPQVLWDLISVKRSLDFHDSGSFNSTGKLADFITRDARVGACLDTRILAVLGLPFEWRWRKVDIYKDVSYIPTEEDIKRLNLFIENFWNRFSSLSLRGEILKKSLMMGFSIMSKAWTPVKLSIGGETSTFYDINLHVFHPSNISFVRGPDYYNIVTRNRIIQIQDSNERLYIIKGIGDSSPWLSALIRRIAIEWFNKAVATGDWRSFSNIHGNPIRKLMTTMENATPPNMDPRQFVIDMVTKIRVGAPVQLPAGHDLQLLEASKGNSDVFRDLVNYCDEQIAIAILGQNLTTQAASGSLTGAAKAHNSVRQDYIEADANLLNETYKDLVKEFYEFNFGEEVEVPIPYWNPAPPENLVEAEQIKKISAEKTKLIVETIKELPTDTQIDIKELLKAFNIPMKGTINE